MTLNAIVKQPKRFRRGIFWAIVIGLFLVGAWVRFPALFAAGVHSDEALFATWARLIGTWTSPLLRGETVDKPPLLFYVQAPFFPLLGTAQIWVSRLPNLAASILIVPLTIRFSWNLYGDLTTSVVAGILIVFSPLLLAFSGTSFTDPLMTMLLLSSLMMAHAREPFLGGRSSTANNDERATRRAFISGLFMGLAIITKYQAILFVPLQLGLVWLQGASGRTWRAWLLGLMAPMLLLALWAQLRGGSLDLLQRQMMNYGGLRASWSWELWPRLEQWGVLWGQLIQAPVLAFGFLLFSPVFLALLIQLQDRDTAFDQLLLLFLLAYVFLHWFIAVPVWERYLLPVAPLALVLLGRFVTRVVGFLQPAEAQREGWLEAAVIVFIAVLVAPPAFASGSHEAARPALEMGPASTAQVAAALSDEPYGTVLYDHWFSWQLRYFLFDSRVFVSWFAHPEALVEDLDAFMDDEENRYVLVPRQPEAIFLLRTVRDAGYQLSVSRSLPDRILYQIGLP